MNMNEEDTFRMLKRIPFTELEPILFNMEWHDWMELRDSEERFSQFLDQYGWTVEEWDAKTNNAY